MRLRLQIIYFSFLLVYPCIGRSQKDRLTTQQKNYIAYSSYALVTSATMVGLYHLWYKDVPSQSFHFFNDNDQWLGMDKFGHMGTAYYLSRQCKEGVLWAEKSPKKAAIQGSIGALIFLTGIEIFDGFSTQWGASYGDMMANFSGAALFWGQEALWQEQRIKVKYSFHFTKFSKIRPSILGENALQQAFKDYNGQSYWLSANPAQLFNIKPFPKWLNIAFGYSASGLIGGKENPLFDQQGNAYPAFDRNRQYFLSLDLDLEKIPTQKKWLKQVFKVFNFIKIPFPSLEINSQGKFKGHLLYF